MKITTGTIRIVKTGGVATHWRGIIQRCELDEAQVIKADEGASVLALPGESGSHGLIVKRWELRSAGARLKSFTHTSRAWRHWRGAARLTRAGIPTATCYAIANSTSPAPARLPIEWLVMDRLPGRSLLQHMADRSLSSKQEHALAHVVGGTVGTMAAKALFNRDGKPSNWIVTNPAPAPRPGSTTPPPPTVAIIDTVAVRSTSFSLAGFRSWIWMLSDLMIEPIGCGCPPRLTLRARALWSFVDACPIMRNATPAAHKAMRRRIWKSVAKAVAAHGDPTPKVNPLAQRTSSTAA